MKEAILYVLDFKWAHGMEEGGVRILFIAFFAVVLLFALRQDEDFVYEGAPDRARWRDLRIWAAGIMAIQIVLYLAI